MASPALHIKDSYYFEVPKFLWSADYQGLQESPAFPDFLVRLDQGFLDWQAKNLLSDTGVEKLGLELPDAETLMHDYHHWLHANHKNAGKPLSTYIEQTIVSPERLLDKGWLRSWRELNAKAGDLTAYRAQVEWDGAKIDGYNHALSGKIVIPQPFGTLKNLYEPADGGFCISKFMIVEVVVALIVGWLFIGLTNKLRNSDAPRGRLANALEAILFYFRDEVARKAIGAKEGDKYVPLLWTIFVFVLGCNLMGMVPWVGAPTASFAVTLAMAVVVLGTGIVMGSRKFGIVGYWTNQVPSMDLPIYMAVILKPMLWVIEVVGLMIKHGVLAVRLLANMVAGHIVLLGIMALAFSLQGALSPSWWVAAPIALVGSTLFSCLELFVAFLQAYIFTFLSALFIGAAIHHH